MPGDGVLVRLKGLNFLNPLLNVIFTEGVQSSGQCVFHATGRKRFAHGEHSDLAWILAMGLAGGVDAGGDLAEAI